MTIVAISVVIAGLPSGIVHLSPSANEPTQMRGDATETLGGTTTSRDKASGTLDADQDRLLDSWERNDSTPEGFALKGSTPSRKDVFLLLLIPENVEPMTEEELTDLAEIWATMPVQNPDGDTGIDLHVSQRTLEGTVTYDGTQEQLEEYIERYYNGSVIGEDALCVAYVGLLAQMPESEYAGRASAPGYFFIADGGLLDDYNQEYTVRTTAITHELLHNVVGKFSTGELHTDEGWLNGHQRSEHGTNFFMSELTRTKISREGFAKSEYYSKVVC